MDPMDAGIPDGPSTPKTHLVAVKSDTNLAAKKRRPGGSPPASARLLSHPTFERSETTSTSAGIEEKRHISFNSRVDQCIAVDYPEDDAEGSAYSDGNYEEDSEEVASSEDEGDLLTMKSSPKSQSTLSLSSRQSSPSADHLHIIAKLAPTLLKTSDAYPAPSPMVVDPTGFTSVQGNGQSKVSVVQQRDHLDDDEFSERSHWEDEANVDYFSAPYANNRGAGTNADAPSIATSGGAPLRPAAPTASVGSGQESNSRSSADTSSNISSSPATSTTSASGSVTSSSANNTQPRSILKKRGPTGASTTSLPEDNSTSVPSAAPAPAKVGQGSAFIAENVAESSSWTSSPPLTSSTGTPHDSNDSQDDESGRGRSSQRLGSSASYERIQEAARKSSGRTGSGGASPTNSYDGGSSAGSLRGSSGTERERRGSFRGRDQDGQQRPGASFRLGAGANDLGEAADNVRPSFSDDDTDSDAALASAAPSLATPKNTKKGGRNHSSNSSKSMSPAGSQRLSVDLDNLPSNDPARMGTAPTPGAGGPTPLNTPTLALARKHRRRGSGSEDSIGSQSPTSTKKSTPTSPVLPRRTSATGALVAPSGADREAGVRVPLADDFVEEDEGGIIGRAVEIVNTARDLIAAVWPTRR